MVYMYSGGFPRLWDARFGAHFRGPARANLVMGHVGTLNRLNSVVLSKEEGNMLYRAYVPVFPTQPASKPAYTLFLVSSRHAS